VLLLYFQTLFGYLRIAPRAAFGARLRSLQNTAKEREMLKESVETALDEIRPALQADGGDVELVGVSEGGVVTVRLTGACHECPMGMQTLKMGIEAHLKKAVPLVTEVLGV
jgi:Fe-S cluster biogenesis protein NfuA